MPCRFRLDRGRLRCRHCGRILPLQPNQQQRAVSSRALDRFENIPRPGVIRVGAYYSNVYVGGAENWLRLLFRHLSPEQFSITGVCVDEQGRLPAIDFRPHKVARDLPGIMAFSDVILAWGVKSLQNVSKLFDGPIVYVGHSGPELYDMGLRLAKHATHYVAVSQACLQSIPERLQHAAKVIYNGIEPMMLPSRQEARQRLGIGDRIAVGFIGRWSREKDPFAAARAVAALSNAVAVYHGYRSTDEHIFRKQVLEITRGRAIFRTPSEDVAETYAALDCFIHTPPFEGFGLTYCEAWQASIPVVSSHTGIVAESGIADRVATLVEPGASGSILAKAVTQSLAGHTIEAGRTLVAERFSARQMGQQWGTFLSEAIASFRNSSIPKDPPFG